jgi:hypothetical protein
MKHFLTFSEAIREGAKLRSQAFGGIRNQQSRSCALVSGYEAITGSLGLDDDYRGVTSLYRYLLEAAAFCPAGCHLSAQLPAPPLLTLIWHLNDAHKWTREAIADWLESEEEKLGYITVYEDLEAKEVAEARV